MALVLVAIKSWAAWQTGSAAMLGSLADSAMDLIASLITLFGVWYAALPADEEHRFGHGKAEAVAALIQVVLIALSAVAILIHSVQQWVSGAGVRAPEQGIGVSAIAIVLTLCLLSWQRYVLARTGSVAIRTDHLHYKSDLLLNLAVIAALVLEAFAGLGGADPVFGFAIAIWLGWNAFRASQEAIDNLLDREWPEEKRRRLVEIAASHPQLSNLHDLRTRTSANRDFAQFHVDLPSTMSVAMSHDVMERVEEDLCREFPGLELFVHIDPAGHVDRPGNRLVEQDEFAALQSDPGGEKR